LEDAAMRIRVAFPVCLVALALAAHAASPPDLLNYQGVLRDASGQPLHGSHDVVFRFFSAAIAGNEILVDAHNAVGGNPVVVSGGLFDVALGGGTVSDGSGPGTYAALSDVFRDHAQVWLAIQINGETLSPRLRVLASAYAMNAGHLDGRDSSFFLDTSSTAQTKAGPLFVDASGTPNFGVDAQGVTGGGHFGDAGQSGDAYVGYGDYGVFASGDVAGGRFEDGNSSALAYVGYGNRGIYASGTDIGGELRNSATGSVAHLAYYQLGIDAEGPTGGGQFRDGDGTATAYVANGSYGIRGYGSFVGGLFADTDGSGWAHVGYADTGIQGYGDASGGYFEDLNSSGWTQVGVSTYKISGSGAVSFVQNHPERSDRVIVYHAPEASEVAVYTRGSARLSAGSAGIALDPTFAWTANPDLGLTANVTPRGACPSLHVASVSTSRLEVRCDDAAGADLEVDFIVWGLRLGFEELPPVKPKEREARIPSMQEHRDLYASHPELRAHNALERFKPVEARRRGLDSPDVVDLGAARHLASGIGEFDPAVHGVQRIAPAELARHALDRPDAEAPSPPGTEEAPEPEDERTATPAVPHPTLRLAAPAEPGDVLALDPDDPGLLRPAAVPKDRGVVGVALAAAGPEHEEGIWEVAVATCGVVTARADAGYGAIRPGDLLTTSPTPGHAMLAHDAIPGTVLGKALDGLDSGTGTIRIVVMPR
jgi:hypothetical protein